MDVARAAQALAQRVASSLLKLMRPRRTFNIQSKIFNYYKSAKISQYVYLHKMHKINC
ncbi:hypothetical protein D1BOALGB6SA_3381 [Olavius sp. associated proteobacterium Delta 1]|nr:hypothetical protein D1BOALGB6SA_3381 [Olavius sp. associated proteobacterium Delta 1]